MKCSTLSLCLLLFGCPLFATDPPANTAQICGGYSLAPIDPEAREVATFAVTTEAKATGKSLQLVKVVRVEKQVVAGINYRLQITVKEEGQLTPVEVIVWRRLDNSLSLTAWK